MQLDAMSLPVAKLKIGGDHSLWPVCIMAWRVQSGTSELAMERAWQGLCFLVTYLAKHKHKSCDDLLAVVTMQIPWQYVSCNLRCRCDVWTKARVPTCTYISHGLVQVQSNIGVSHNDKLTERPCGADQDSRGFLCSVRCHCAMRHFP